MKAPDSEVISYLNKYSIKGIELIWNPDPYITTAVVVPAIKEYDNIKKLLLSLAKMDAKYFLNTIFIFAVNNLASSGIDVKEDNYRTLDYLKSILDKSSVDNFNQQILSSGLKIGYIDACSPGRELNEKSGGVGLARKIGMDAALKIFNYEDLNKEKILICLDADCEVKENYLTEIHNQFYGNKIKACSIYFEHNLNNPDTDNSAIICYETFLRYYVMCLRYAGSFYAFHTVGSAMACDHSTYIKVEGMNKKKAAEDFYFLEKVSKHTKIFNIRNTIVYPSERKSWRVPFGTGQRVTRFHAKTHQEYLLYDPADFEILKEWLKIFHKGDILSPEQYITHAKSINLGLHEFLQQQNFLGDINAILSSSKSDNQVRIQMLRWFDGFRTLKLIHFLRNNYLPDINMYDALDIMLAKYNITIGHRRNNSIPCKEIQIQYLEKLRFLDRN